MDRQATEVRLQQLIQARDRLVVEVHRHDGAIALLSSMLAESEPKAAISQFPMAVNSTSTTAQQYHAGPSSMPIVSTQ